MKKFITKKTLIIVAVILLLFVITNPSPNALKDHLGVKSTLGIQRKYNFFFFSIYTYDDKYIGFAGNFIHIDPDTIPKIDTPKIKKDSLTREQHASKLYRGLLSDGYSIDVLGSENDFIINLKDTNKATKLY